MPVRKIACISVRVTMSICCCVNFDWTLMTRKLISGNCRSICGSARNDVVGRVDFAAASPLSAPA